MTQVSELEGRVTKKLFQEFSRTKRFRIPGALSTLSEFFLNPQIRVQFGIIPGISRNSNGENQERNEDRPRDDPDMK